MYQNIDLSINKTSKQLCLKNTNDFHYFILQSTDAYDMYLFGCDPPKFKMIQLLFSNFIKVVIALLVILKYIFIEYDIEKKIQEIILQMQIIV